MPVWVNYHSHTIFCDGSDVPLNYIEKAIELGLPAYGFSSHAPLPFPVNWCIPDDKLDIYLNEIRDLKETYKNKIQLYLGLEVDYIPNLAGRTRYLLKNTALDYFVGSVHFIDAFSDLQPWNIDTSYELFVKGLKEIFDNNVQKAVCRYFEITREMIAEDKPNIIGHLDKIKMHNTRGHFFNEMEHWYRDQINITLKAIKKSDCRVEINTRGYYRYNQPELYPSAWIIAEMTKMEIPLMINSDAHQPNEIIKGMEYAAKNMKALGVKKIQILLDNTWKEFDFTEKGILIC